MQSTVMMSTLNMDTSVDNRIQHDSLTAVIRDFRESINQSNRDAQPMTEEEFSQFVNYIRRRIFTNTSPLPQTENNNSREILETILQESRNQTEFLRRITDILSNITETRTVIKLSLAFVFVWTINKFLQNK
jgi:hemerythrin-like domain-containing protein